MAMLNRHWKLKKKGEQHEPIQIHVNLVLSIDNSYTVFVHYIMTYCCRKHLASSHKHTILFVAL